MNAYRINYCPQDYNKKNREILDKYNNRPPFRRISESTGHIGNSKDSNYYLVNFQHKAYIDALKKDKRPRSVSPTLPKISYLQKTPTCLSKAPNPKLEPEVKKSNDSSQRNSRHHLFKKLMGNFDKTPSSTTASEQMSQPSLEKVASSTKVSEKSNQKNLVVNVVREEIQKQNDDLKNGCFCESNMDTEERQQQRRPRSVPSSEKCRNVRKFRNPRAVELFNPDYNFESKYSGLHRTGMTLLDSIRKRVFSNNEATFDTSVLDDSWDEEVKFPKETRNAMMSMLNGRRKHTNIERKNPLIKNSETQTSPTMSTTRVYPAFKVPKNFKKIPCPKNLLCEKGLHTGKCSRIVCQKQKVTFSKKETYPCIEIWHVPDKSCSSEESFLKIMEPKRDATVFTMTSSENSSLSIKSK